MNDFTGILGKNWNVIAKLHLGEDAEFAWKIEKSVEDLEKLDLRNSLIGIIDINGFIHMVASYIMNSINSKVLIEISGDDLQGICQVNVEVPLLNENIESEVGQAFIEAKKMFFRSFKAKIEALTTEYKKL